MFIERSEHKKIVTLTLNRPESLNALNMELLEALKISLEELSPFFPSKYRALVITGKGDKSFAAGADIKEMSQFNAQKALEFSQKGQEIFSLIEKLPVPTVAAVNGYALGGGLELALSCDWIYCTHKSVFALPEVSLGLIPGFGGTGRLAFKIGLPRATEMILLAKKITSNEAYEWGLVNKVLEPNELLPKTYEYLEILDTLSPLAIAQAKRLLYKGWSDWLLQSLERESESFSYLFDTQEAKEGMAAFLEKRKAVFKKH